MKIRLPFYSMVLVVLIQGFAAWAIAASAAPQTIPVGAVASLTGFFSNLGNQAKAGYELGVEDVNRAGGIFVKEYGKKLPLELIIQDSESSSTKVISMLEWLYTSKKVVTYLGEGVIQYAQGVPEKNKIPAVVVGSPHLRPHERGFKYWFSAFGKTSDSARFICDVLDSVPTEKRAKTFAIFQEQTDYGLEQAEGFRKEVLRRGYKAAAFEKYTQQSKDFSPLIMAAKNAGAEAVLGNPGAPDGMAMMRQMKELDFNPKAVAFIRAAQDLSWGKALGPMGDYVVLSTYWHHRVKYPGVDKLNAAYQAKFGRPADVLAGPAYAAVQVLAAAIERAGSLDPTKIRNAIAATDMMTVEGSIKFRPDGTIFDPCPAVVQWQGGSQKLVWPQEFRETAFIYPTPPWQER